MPHFVIAVPQGALAASVGATLDVLHIASRASAGLQQRAVSWQVVSSRKQVQLSGGLALAAEPLQHAHIPSHAILVFPGIGLDHPQLDRGKGIDERFAHSNIQRRLAMADARAFAALAESHHGRAGKTAASCSGVLFLAMAGVLDGRMATTHWRLSSFFAQHFPQVMLDTQRMVIDDRGVVSAAAAMAQMDLMLYLVRHSAGKNIAELVMKYLLMDMRASQARYQVWDQLRESDANIAAHFEALMELSLPEPPSIAEAARRLHLTPRTLARRVFSATGSTPKALLQSVRMRHAQQLLSLGHLPLEEVAQRVGYANASSLRKLYTKLDQQPHSTDQGLHRPEKT